jgi:hypothetical protein
MQKATAEPFPSKALHVLATLHPVLPWEFQTPGNLKGLGWKDRPKRGTNDVNGVHFTCVAVTTKVTHRHLLIPIAT